MNISKIYPRRFARGEDLKGAATVTIREISKETLHPAGRPTEKYILWFAETEKGVILTRALAHQIAAILGDDTDSWLNKKITLYPLPISVAGRACVAIRARTVL